MQKETVGDLTILNAQLRHGGKYTCMAQTVVDSVSKEATVLVRGEGFPPPPPDSLRAQLGSSDPCSLTPRLSLRPWGRASDISPLSCLLLWLFTGAKGIGYSPPKAKVFGPAQWCSSYVCTLTSAAGARWFGSQAGTYVPLIQPRCGRRAMYRVEEDGHRR